MVNKFICKCVTITHIGKILNDWVKTEPGFALPIN